MRALFRLIGKTGGKVVAIFAATAQEAAASVLHVRAGNVGFPILLFCLETPTEDTRRSCSRAFIHPSGSRLFFIAQKELWSHWVALGVTSWTGRPGAWLLKIAPFCLPPFRILILNENGDFLPGKPKKIWTHVWRKTRNSAELMWANVVRQTGGLGADYIERLGHIVRGLLAYPFAFFAQQFSPLSRLVFGFLGGNEPHLVSPARSKQGGIVTFALRGREWHPKALEELMANTNSRWILFQQEGVGEPADDLIPLFSNERTFAVSRQFAYRGWQRLLFPTAPFQTLQPDEASRVFAPFSTQILVDRAKLRALGVPKLSESGSNWYLLFWKAAAAGWSSYSVGSSATKLNELAGTPYYDAQFVHALLVNPTLARLKPRNPALSRGNISFSKTGGKGFRGLPRVLILSPYLPYPLSHGGAVRIYSLCQALADRVDFVLLCFREKNDVVQYDKLYQVFREVFVVAMDEKHFDSKLPKQISGYEASSMRALIPDVCFHLRIDLLQIEYTQMAAYREAMPDLPAILVEHDITFTLFRQLADRTPGRDAEREYWSWLKFEKERLRAFDLVWTMSDYDRDQAIQAGSTEDRTLAVPNGVDLKRFAGSPSAVDSIEEILYVGSFRHQPNFLGFEELRDRVMPAVWAKFPAIRLTVVAGPEHEKFWSGSREVDPRIVVHGFVSEIAALYHQCQLVVVPLPVSAGTNVKVMEALATERAVVTTPVGCVGLGLEDGRDVVIRPLGAEFATAIVELAGDRNKRQAIAAQGRRTAEERYSWASIAETALASYRTLLGNPNGADDPVLAGRERSSPQAFHQAHTSP